MLLPQFNFLEKIFSKIGCTITKKFVCVCVCVCVCVREGEKEREKQGRGNDSCHFSDQDFLPCYLCKYPNILFLNNNVIFQQKNLPINSGNLVGIG